MQQATAGERLKLMFITNDPTAAVRAVAAGADRIFVDLEQLGKRERQGHLDTHLAEHSVADVAAIREVLPRGELLARVNPMHAGLRREVDEVVAAGADIIMLPMFTTADEVARFCELVRRRARICLLLETPQALARLPAICSLADGFDEIHVGLNDLHLGMGLAFMFELLAGGLVEYIARQAHSAGVAFGIGGIARVGHGAVPAEYIIGEHVRLASKLVILSRDFAALRQAAVGDPAFDLALEIKKIRDCEERFRAASATALEANASRFRRLVAEVVAMRTAA
jgi:2-keto-3-deoxy-L-rhamnonate aldolase RhmA